MTAPTKVVYRVPDLPPDTAVGVLVNILSEGAIPLATVELRQALWARGGPEARLAERLNQIVNNHRAKVVPIV